jgi:cell shape-determining protein MreC
MHLKELNFNGSTNQNFDQKKHIGFIARKLNPILPEVVNKSSVECIRLIMLQLRQFFLKQSNNSSIRLRELRQQMSKYSELKSELDVLKQELEQK